MNVNGDAKIGGASLLTAQGVDEVARMLSLILSSESERAVADEYSAMCEVFESPSSSQNEGVCLSLSANPACLRWLPLLVCSVNPSARTWARDVLERHVAAQDVWPTAACDLLEAAVLSALSRITACLGAMVGRDTPPPLPPPPEEKDEEEELFPSLEFEFADDDDGNDDVTPAAGGSGRVSPLADAEGGVPLSHDPAVLWYAVQFVRDVAEECGRGEEASRVVRDAVRVAAATNMYVRKFQDQQSVEETKHWFLKACLGVGATPDIFSEVFHLTLPAIGANIGPLCEYLAAHASMVQPGHIELLAEIRSSAEDRLELAPMSVAPARLRHAVGVLVWGHTGEHVRTIVARVPNGAEVCVATAGAMVQEVLAELQRWTQYLAASYTAGRTKRPMTQQENAGLERVEFPSVHLLFEGLAANWASIPAAARMQLCASVLPLASLFDGEALANFLAFTRLDARLKPAFSTEPLAALAQICASVDALAAQALQDEAHCTSTLKAAFLLAPQHPRSHEVLLRNGRSAAENLVLLVTNSEQAQQFISIAIRACCAMDAKVDPTQGRSADSLAFVTDVRMAVHARVAIGVISSLSEGLVPYVETKYVTGILVSTQRCLAFWKRLGLSFGTVMLSAMKAEHGAWCTSIMRCVASAETEHEAQRWAEAVAHLAEHGAFDTEEARGLFHRIARRQRNTVLAAVAKVEAYTPSAGRLRCWAAGEAYPQDLQPDGGPQRAQPQQQQQPPPLPEVEGDGIDMQYSIGMLDEDDEADEADNPAPKLPPPPPRVPRKKRVVEEEEDFVLLAKKVLPAAPCMPKLSRTQMQMRKLARLGGASSQVKVEIQPCGAAWVTDAKPKELRTTALLPTVRPAYVPQAFTSAAVAEADKRYLRQQKAQKSLNIKRLRDSRFPSQKRELLRGLLERDASAVALKELPSAYVSEDHYANALFPHILWEACEGVARAVEELRMDTPDVGVVVERSNEKYTVTVEFAIAPQRRYFSDADLVAVKHESASSKDGDVYIGKVESYFRYYKRLQLRFTPSQYQRVASQDAICVQPLTKVVGVFHQNYVTNHLSMLPLCSQILSAAPPDAAAREQKYQQFLRAVPTGFAAYLQRRFNTSQQEAITRSAAARNGFSLIQGPPGTGKTHTIVGLLGLLLMKRAPQGWSYRYPRVLVVAPSNTAVDELALRIASNGLRDSAGEVYNPRLVRAGIQEKVDDRLKPLYLDNIMQLQLEARREAQAEEDSVEAQRFKRQREEIEKETARLTEYEAEFKLNSGYGKVGKSMLFNQSEKVRMLKQKMGADRRVRDARATAAEQNWRKVQQGILEEAAIVCTTLGFCKNLACGTFEVVIIDEAAQAVEPDVLLALKNSARHVVMVGDDKQLPATVLSQRAAAGGYATSLFSRLRTGGHVPCMLKTQFRMHPSIRAFPSLQFYDNQLMDHSSILKREERTGILAYSVVNAPEGRSRRPYSSSSLQNSVEASFVVEAAASLVARMGIKPCDIGIISPYNAQVNLVRDMLRSRKLREVEVGSVDAYQGREKVAIIVTMVRAPGDGAGLGFTKSPERVNVSITRGREVVIVVCHAETLYEAPVWRATIDNASARGLFFSGCDLKCYLPHKKNPPRPQPLFAKTAEEAADPRNVTAAGAPRLFGRGQERSGEAAAAAAVARRQRAAEDPAASRRRGSPPPTAVAPRGLDGQRRRTPPPPPREPPTTMRAPEAKRVRRSAAAAQDVAVIDVDAEEDDEMPQFVTPHINAQHAFNPSQMR